MSFWSELKRRNVFKAGIAYLIVAWLILQVAAIIFPMLHMPSWTGTFVTILIVIGFPMVLIFAWAFEITPGGLKRTHEVPQHESITHLTGQKLNYIVTGLLVIAVAYILIDNYYLDRRFSNINKTSVDIEMAEKTKTIAVLPFIDLSPEKDQEYFVDGLSEEILNSLAQITELYVTGRTSSFSFKGTDKKVQEIAVELGVDNILEGSVRKAGNAIRITAQLLRGADGFHLWSKTYDRELKDIFKVQEDIAVAVAGELETMLGIERLKLKLGGTDNSKAYELYMTAQALYHAGPFNLSHALESIDAAITIDPNYALAWALKSIIHNGLSRETLSADINVTAEQESAINSARKAIELSPNLATAYYSLGVTKTFRGEWIEAELAYRKAIEFTNEPSMEYKVVHPFHYQCVAYFKRANEILAAELQNDPLNHGTRSQYMESFVCLNDFQKVEDEYERGKALLGDDWWMGDKEILGARIGAGEKVPFDDILNSWCFREGDECRERIKSQEDLLTEMRRNYNDENTIDSNAFVGIAEFGAYFSDNELAMDAVEKAIAKDPTSAGVMWTPLMKKVRQLPRFNEFIREIGLVDYWDKFGWPDICRPLGNGEFVCD